MKEVAVIRLLVDEETGEYKQAVIWHDPEYDHMALLREAAGTEAEE